MAYIFNLKKKKLFIINYIMEQIGKMENRTTGNTKSRAYVFTWNNYDENDIKYVI